jgi:outer membrane autotransporter protein
LRSALNNIPDPNNTITFNHSGNIALGIGSLTTINTNVDFSSSYNVLISSTSLSNAALFTLGTNSPTLSISQNIGLSAEGSQNVTAIYGRRSINIGGSLGSDIDAHAVSGSGAYGVFAAGNYTGGFFGTFSPGNITINGDLSGDVTALASNGSAYGLRAGSLWNGYLPVGGNIQINGDLSGDVSAEAQNGSNAFGLLAQSGGGAQGNISITGDLTRRSDISAVASNNFAYGMYAGWNLSVGEDLNGDVSATASSGSYAYGMNAGGSISIGDDIGRDSEITAYAGNSRAYAMNSLLGNISVGDDLDGDVSATASSGSYAYGMNANGSISIGDDIGRSGDITAYAYDSRAYGMDAGLGISIGDDLDGDISATASSGSYAYGMNAIGSISIGGDIGRNSEITAHAGNSRAYGISSGFGSISIGEDLQGDISATAENGSYSAGISAGWDVTIGDDLSRRGDVTAYSGQNFATGILAGRNIIIGGELAGEVRATASAGHSAAGLSAGWSIYGSYDGGSGLYTPLLISGTVSADAGNGAAAGIQAYGPMHLDITGTVSGNDLGGSLGYAIRSGGFNFSGGFTSSIASLDSITVRDDGQLTGNVDLGAGADSMWVKDSAIISTVPALSGGYNGSIIENDTLTFDGWTGTLGNVVTDWETILVTNSSTVDLGADKTIAPSTGNTLVMTIDPGSVVKAMGSSPGTYTIAGALADNGTLDMMDNAVDDEVTVTGNYSGTGYLRLDADLSTSDKTSDERLIVGGSASGPTTVIVNNVVSPVAVTEGDGVEIITVDGTSSAGAFVLGNPNNFGPFAVSLVEGADEDWYLQSPGYREEAAVLQAVTPFVEKLGYESIPRFHERRTYTWFADKNAEKSAFWVRGYGSKYRLGMSGDAATELDGYSGGMQIGTDIAAGGQDTRHNIGMYAGIGYNEADVAGLRSDQAGKLNDTAYSVGLYATVHNPDKFYIEGVAQASNHDIDIDYLTYPKHDVDLWSYLASLEVGVGIPFSDCFTLQPQAQLVYQHTGGFGIWTPMLTGDVDIAEHDALQGRLGITGMFKSCEYDFNPFFEINLIKDFSESNSVTYYLSDALYPDTKEPVTLSSKPETLFLGGAIGISRKVSEKNNLSYFLKAEAIYGLDDLDSYNYRLSAGIRKTW